MGITKTCFFVSISFLNLIQISLGIFHCLQLLKLYLKLLNMYLTLQVVVLFNICAKHKDQDSVSIKFRFSFIIEHQITTAATSRHINIILWYPSSTT